jgi:hypothetical protein
MYRNITMYWFQNKIFLNKVLYPDISKTVYLLLTDS